MIELPEPDLTHDRHGHMLLIGPCYTAATVRRLIAEAVEKEREACAKVCEWLPYGTGLAGKTFAEAIRARAKQYDGHG